MEYVFDSVLPIGYCDTLCLCLIFSENFYIAFYNSNLQRITSSGLFFIVPGGPTPQISVSLHGDIMSTVGGGLYSAPYGQTTTISYSTTPVITPTTSSAPITPHDHNRNLSKSATIGIGVATALVVIILIGAAGYFLWTKHRRLQKKTETDLLPLQKFPASKNLEVQEREVVDGPRVDIWSH
jgi:hypothetical protein